MLSGRQGKAWYYATSTLVIAFLCVGPFALPLLWFNPRFATRSKILISIIVLVLTYLLGIAFMSSLKSLNKYYQLMY